VLKAEIAATKTAASKKLGITFFVRIKPKLFKGVGLLGLSTVPELIEVFSRMELQITFHHR